uniref:Leucine-rich repeat-containing protein 7 n=1 Tax=Oncorhynchus mykiss TaxID=8022 RepID=A0A8K9Y6S6_ONCMY
MTTKRKIIGRLVPCRCFRGEEEVISVLDYSHCSLQQVPKEIFSFERTLEELYLDANQIEELPKQLFNCQALRKLSIPDNDLSNLPTTIASLVNLRELDISKNGIQEFPDNIKCCKCLSVVEASVNPIAKLPEGFTQLLNLTQLFLNDAFLEYLPFLGYFLLSSSPALVLDTDVMCVCFVFQPEVLEQIHNLKELWMDNNSLQTIPGCIGKLRHLRYLDLAKNRIESLDTDISGCESLEDLLLSSNMLQHLPDTIGMLKKLTTLKVDDNQLTSLPNTIGSLSLLEEFDCSCNELESLPPTIGYLHNLRTFSADENFLVELPREIGNCKNVTVMSLRSNKLEFLPDEIGQMTKLHVLNLSDNRLKNLPFTFTKLKDLAALWLSDNQSKALIPLQTEAHPETKQRVLTNYMFPQQPRHDEDYQSDSDSFNPTLWEEQRQQRMTVAFEFEEKKEEEDNSGKVEINLKRYPTPYPEDLKNMVKSVQNMVGKNQHPLSTNCSGTNMESRKQEQYEPPWPMPPKEVTGQVTPHTQRPTHTISLSLSLLSCVCVCFYVSVFCCVITHFSSQDSMGGSPNDIRISDMRPTLVEPPMYKPKVVLLGKDKKGRPQTFVAGILIQYKHNQYHLRICNNCPLFPYLNALPGTFPSTGTWGYLDSRNSGQGRSSQQANMYQHVQSKPTRPSSGAMVMSKSSERLSPMMKEVKAKFKKSQSIDEIDMGSYNVYSIPVDTYSSSIENQGSVDRPDMPGPMEQSMSRSQSAPMLDDDDAYGTNSQQQKPSIPKKVYHFDQSFNPQGAMDLRNQQQERRAPPPFPNTPEYVNHPGKTLQRSRPGFLRRADSLVSSTELALFRRVQEAKEMQQKSDHYGRQHFKGMLEHQNSLASMAQQDQQYNKRNGRYEEDYSSYQEPKKPITGYPTKSLTQRRPLSARSYSTETFGASQARPVSARPTMAALLEKISPDYNLSICTENIKSPDEMKMRTMQLQLKPDDMSSKMPVDWRQQLLRHIEAKRLDRVSLTTSFSLWEYTVASSILHDCTPSTYYHSAGAFIRRPDYTQFCVRIEKNPGLGFSISGGISGQGNPFKPSDMGIFVTRVQPDGPASNLLQPGDKILKANGHSFLHMEHETAVSLLKNFQKTVDLVILRESTI